MRKSLRAPLEQPASVYAPMSSGTVLAMDPISEKAFGVGQRTVDISPHLLGRAVDDERHMHPRRPRLRRNVRGDPMRTIIDEELDWHGAAGRLCGQAVPLTAGAGGPSSHSIPTAEHPKRILRTAGKAQPSGYRETLLCERERAGSLRIDADVATAWNVRRQDVVEARILRVGARMDELV